MTFRQIDNILNDFSSWMKFTPYGKLMDQTKNYKALNDNDGLSLPESFKANVYNDLLEDVRADIRNGDYLPSSSSTTVTPPTDSTKTNQVPSTDSSLRSKSAPPADNFIIDEDPTGAIDRNSPRDQGTQSAPSTAPTPSAPSVPDDF
jgi:hypothetical protein